MKPNDLQLVWFSISALPSGFREPSSHVQEACWPNSRNCQHRSGGLTPQSGPAPTMGPLSHTPPAASGGSVWRTGSTAGSGPRWERVAAVPGVMPAGGQQDASGEGKVNTEGHLASGNTARGIRWSLLTD